MCPVQTANLYSGPTQEPRLYSPEKLAAAGYHSSRPLPSVTTILRVLNKPAFVPAALKAAGDALMPYLGLPLTEEMISAAKSAWSARSRSAMDIGSRIHALCEAHGRGEHVSLAEEPEQVVNGFEAYLAWVFETGFVATEIEKVIAGDGYAGCCDAIGVMRDGTRVLVDWKSGRGGSIYNEYILQWHAYAAPLAIMDGYIVSFDRDTGECYHHEMRWDSLAYEAFLSARTLYEWIDNGVK